ncbi:hypothetical protein [Parvularcula maris]|uniref:Uncharacterized protein n=1 Tax=Parvularcula maris TaxID=2965077 RepID=A0A9X2L6N8_9PROT|nr:hypothetical protein [Parvularcula maris]MCQ8183973.1 hypothetical protein [Parvularcula maris]
MSGKPRSARYTAELIAVLTLYAVALIAMNVLDTEGWPQALRIALLLGPAAAAVLIVPVVLRFVATMDEFQRRVIAESCLVSMVVVGLTSFAYAFVQEPLGLPAIGLIWVWPALMGGAGLAQIPVRMRLS